MLVRCIYVQTWTWIFGAVSEDLPNRFHEKLPLWTGNRPFYLWINGEQTKSKKRILIQCLHFVPKGHSKVMERGTLGGMFASCLLLSSMWRTQCQLSRLFKSMHRKGLGNFLSGLFWRGSFSFPLMNLVSRKNSALKWLQAFSQGQLHRRQSTANLVLMVWHKILRRIASEFGPWRQLRVSLTETWSFHDASQKTHRCFETTKQKAPHIGTYCADYSLNLSLLIMPIGVNVM